MSKIIGNTVGTTYNPEKIKPSADEIKEYVFGYLETNFDGILPSGADGSKWFVKAMTIGERPPSDITEPGAKEGDILLSTVTYDLFVLTEGVWKLRGNIKGAQGDKGDTGAQGDKGTKGTDGATWHLGTTVEHEGEAILEVSGAKIGDIYLNTNSFEYFLAAPTGDWKKQGCLKGDKGDKGDSGDKGAPGKDGRDGINGYSPEKGKDYFTPTDRAEIIDELADEIITQNTGDSTDKAMSQAAVTAALERVTVLPHGGSPEWLEENGDRTKLYQIGGYVWGYTEAEGWVRSDTRFLVVTSTAQMTNAGGTPYLLRSGDMGRVYEYHGASGDAGVPVYDTLPGTANTGDVAAVGGRKYRASVTEKQVPDFTNKADLTDTSDNNWKSGYRLNSSGTSTTSTASPAPMVTNYVACETGDIVRVKGLTLGGSNCAVFKTGKTVISAEKPTFPSSSSVGCSTEMEGADVYKFTVTEGNAAFLRFGGVPTGSTSDVIITVNEEISYHTETTVTWTDIGEYTPPVEAGWSATTEHFDVFDTLPDAPEVSIAVNAGDGYVYTYLSGSGWAQLGRYDAPTLSVDGELSDSSGNAVQNKAVTAALREIGDKAEENAAEIAVIGERLTEMETGSGGGAIPSFWKDAVDECIAKIKALQVDKNCVTFPFFSDNHTREGKTQYMGIMIAHIMKECGIPYCFFGGDAITSAQAQTPDSDAEFKAQAKAFDTAMSYIPDGRFCMALGNHETWLVANPGIEGSVRVDYDRDQTYNIFLREKGAWQNKHFGGDGTYYYVDDSVSKVRWIVLNTNGIGNSAFDEEQRSWFENTALKFGESGWGAVIISHIPITNHYEQSNITNNTEVIAMLQGYINGTDPNKADIIGWFSGHIHRDRIYTGVSVNDTDDTESGDMGFSQVTITSDHTGIAYPLRESSTYHPVGNDDLSHAIDFVTINKSAKAVNLTRLGIGDDRSYTY